VAGAEMRPWYDWQAFWVGILFMLAVLILLWAVF
jgi:hypothetical protein